uniref:Uncharacterized protein n=1 Tax=Pygocentrus nattereri TaxID=42514 RepID=A0AAR2LST3_PYGNA
MNFQRELSEFQRGTVIGRHLCSKSSREISSLLNIPQSNVSGIISHRSPTFCRVNHYRPPNFMWPSDQLKNSVESFMEWVSMAEQPHPSLISPSNVISLNFICI